jgi:hypothetical protein
VAYVSPNVVLCRSQRSSNGGKTDESFVPRTLALAAAATGIVRVAAFAQEKKEAAGGHGIAHTTDLKWTPPANWYPPEENVTVIKGVFQVGLGERFDASGLETMNLGDFGSIPKEMRHFALRKTATIVQVNGMARLR